VYEIKVDLLDRIMAGPAKGLTPRLQDDNEVTAAVVADDEADDKEDVAPDEGLVNNVAAAADAALDAMEAVEEVDQDFNDTVAAMDGPPVHGG